MPIHLFVAAALLGNAPLPAGLARQVDTIAAAYHQEDSVGVRKVLAPIVARWKDEQIAAVDTALADRDIPPVRELLLEARMNLMRQKLTSALPEPGLRERLLTLQTLSEERQAIMKSKDEHPVVLGKFPQPNNLEEFEELGWELHVLQNKLLTAERSAQYARELADGVPERIRRRLTASERELLDEAASLAPLAGAIEAQRELQELEMEKRLERLNYGLDVLADPALRKERFLAAYSTAVDGRVLTEFFEQSQTEQQPILSGVLNDPGLPGDVAEKTQRARELAGSLAERAEELFDGLHWWLRGRYGTGPELDGLAKSAASLENPGSLVWLYMPTSRPVPRPPTAEEGPGVPQFERRHHHTWAWEDRRVQHSVLRFRSVKKSSQPLATSAFW